ncbi:type IV secretion system DNA-binding domain-containing protein, partial [Candidatus Uhrbacteria bacterium]|nr:type IV secretion system DNA-binding domain-containing protein [Candidatus Uhrbacteria bacterium]
MPQSEIVLVGQTNFRNKQARFGIKTDDRRRHMYVVGKTGMGKSTLLESMLFQDIQAGRGLSVVDPHGDLAEKILDFVPAHRINDVIYFNPADTDYPIAFNVLEKVDASQRHLVTSGLIGVFKKIWADSWGPRLEYLLRNSILALLDYPDSTLLGINRLMTDKAYRKKVIEKIQDPVVKAFWVDEYSKYPDKFATEAIAPIQNKVGQFLSSSLIRNIVGQVKSTISMRDIMDQGKILILNLSKGRIGEDNSALLGAMMITKIQLAAMSRVNIPEKERRDFYLYVDEFQNFATDSFADILSEARKYRLDLIIAHQYIEQLGEVVKPAVFGNVGTMIVFRVGAADAEELVKEFSPYFTEEDIVGLAKYHMYLKLMIDGIASTPFSALGLPPVNIKLGNHEKIIDGSRERYARPREVVEEKIRKWSGMEIIPLPGAAPAPVVSDEEEEEGEGAEAVQPTRSLTMDKARAPEPERKPVLERPREAPRPVAKPRVEVSSGGAGSGGSGSSTSGGSPAGSGASGGQGSSGGQGGKKKEKLKDVACTSCGKMTKPPFKPDGRPIYCNDCFQKIKKSPVEKKVVEIKPTESSISLEEALKRKPINFKGNKPGSAGQTETAPADEKPTVQTPQA